MNPEDHSRNQHTEKCSVPYTSLIHLSSAVIAEVQLILTTVFPQDLSQTSTLKRVLSHAFSSRTVKEPKRVLCHAHLPILPTHSVG